MPEFMSVSEVANCLNISRQAVHKKIQSGEFPTVKVGRLYRIRKDWFMDYIKRGGDTDGQGERN